MSKSDAQLKWDVEAELQWERRVDASRIGVRVKNGAVTLTGEVDTYAEKWAAEDAARRVRGVRSALEELSVKVFGLRRREDMAIEQAARRALRSDVWVPDTVRLAVHQGEITLSGSVEWKYQRLAAESAARNLAGVTTVYNEITVKPRTSFAQVKETLRLAPQR